MISAIQSLICQMKRIRQYTEVAYRIFECLNLSSSSEHVLIDLSFLCGRWFGERGGGVVFWGLFLFGCFFLLVELLLL